VLLVVCIRADGQGERLIAQGMEPAAERAAGSEGFFAGVQVLLAVDRTFAVGEEG
jgi:hypothetical protein